MQSETEYRPYDPDRDLAAVQRIWREVGWIDSTKGEESLVPHLAAGEALVATIRGEAEALAVATPAEISYLGTPLSLCAVTGVTTSRIARRLGFAQKLTAGLLANHAARGCAVTALGMFDQGFYNQLGYGNGPYEHELYLDPKSLLVSASFRPPERFAAEDYEEIHQALLNRHKSHGAVDLLPPEIIKAELMPLKDGFGLGYRDAEGARLSHFIYGRFKGENGPVRIDWMTWQTPAQLLELLALIRSFADQVDVVRIQEFADLQLQDLLRQPIRQERISTGAKTPYEHRSIAYWQLRMLNLMECIEKTHLFGPEVEFNLRLQDPIEKLLPEESSWRGLGGDYHVHLGASSTAGPGFRQGLPCLTASVNAFSRLWLGVSSAPMLAITDQLQGDASLLRQLELSLCLPSAHFGWEF